MSSSKKSEIYTSGGGLRRKLIHFPCPLCGCRLKELAESRGKKDKCPECKCSIVIPALNKAGVSEPQPTQFNGESFFDNGVFEVISRSDDELANFLIELDANASKADVVIAEPEASGDWAKPKAVPNHPKEKLRDARSTTADREKPKADDEQIEFIPLSVPAKLTNCEDCGKQVSKKASHCPNCGCPVVADKLESRDFIVQSISDKTSKDLGMLSITLMAVFVVLFVASVITSRSGGSSHDYIVSEAIEQANVSEGTLNTKNEVARTNPISATTTPLAESTRVFRKELFEKVRRSALQFKSNAPEFPEQLRLELAMVAGEVASESERKAFAIYERIEDLQRSITVIENLKKGTELMVVQYKLKKLDAITRKLSDESDLMDRQIRALSGEFSPSVLSVPDRNLVSPQQIDELLNMHNSGFIAVDIGGSANAVEWCRKNYLTILKPKFFSYIQYQPVRKQLDVDLAANLLAAETFVQHEH